MYTHFTLLQPTDMQQGIFFFTSTPNCKYHGCKYYGCKEKTLTDEVHNCI